MTDLLYLLFLRLLGMNHFKLADTQKLWNSILQLWRVIVNHAPFQLSAFAIVQLHIKHLVKLLMRLQIAHLPWFSIQIIQRYSVRAFILFHELVDLC
jgi:hypothetical protein